MLTSVIVSCPCIYIYDDERHVLIAHRGAPARAAGHDGGASENTGRAFTCTRELVLRGTDNRAEKSTHAHARDVHKIGV
jgi:hypothetical protein